MEEREIVFKSRNYFSIVPKFRRCIVVLEKCYLEVMRIGSSFKLLNADDHWRLLKRIGRKSEMYRPDIVHSCLLSLFDSPINKTGSLEVFLRTHKGVLIKINPICRVPRTFQRFCGLMVQLLHKLTIKTGDGETTLMKVIKNPLTKHLPNNLVLLGTSAKATTKVKLQDFVPIKLGGSAEKSILFSVGAFSKGSVEKVDYQVDETICVSEYNLSAAVVCGKILNTMENYWDIY